MSQKIRWISLAGAIILCSCLAAEVSSPPKAKLNLWDGTAVGTGGSCPGEYLRVQDNTVGDIAFMECPEPPTCTDLELNAIMQEYAGWPGHLIPNCDDFSMVGGNATFTWPALNGYWAEGNEPQHNPWGLIRIGTMSGLNHTYFFYDPGIVTVTSGYRCPDGNAQIPGAVVYSYHVRGRAIDMYGKFPWTEEEYNRLLASALSSWPGPVEWFGYDKYADHHLHVAW